MFEKIINIKYDKKLYHIYKYIELNNINQCYIIKGCNQDGNDYIIKNAQYILKKYLNVEETENLIWIHGDGPSPHFILYKDDNIKIKSETVERFIKSVLPKKANKDKQLSCSMLSDIMLTDIKGLVFVKQKKLNKLLL